MGSVTIGAAGGEGTAGDDADCVFCHAELQPSALYETSRLRVVPDKFPVIPGHTLIISKEHLACFGASDDPGLLVELDATIDRTRRFIRDEYGVNPLVWENGITGQTVFHAHVHLIPTDRVKPLSAIWVTWDPIDGWDDVRARYREKGDYHYVEIGDQRYLLEGDGPASWQARAMIAKEAGLKRIAGRWVRATSEEDVAEVGRRFARWEPTHRG